MSSTKTGELMYNSRVLKRLTIQDVADSTGVSKGMISFIETGKQTTKKVIFLKKICKVLSIEEDDIKKAVIDDFTDKLLREWEG